MEPQFLSKAVLSECEERGVSGVLVLYTETGVWSPASSTPQAEGSPDLDVNPTANAAYAWNAAGMGVLGQRWPFPVFAVSRCDSEWLRDTVADRIKKGGGPDYTAKLDDYMGPDQMNSAKCLAQQACQPLGGFSAWASKGILSRDDTRKVMVVAAAMDTTALFHDLSYGAESAASAIIAMLAAAKATRKIPSTQDSLPTHRIVFAAFQSEAYGFAGSRKWLEDLTSFACTTPVTAEESPTGAALCVDPFKASLAFAQIDPAKVDLVLAVDQIGHSSGADDPLILRSSSAGGQWRSAFEAAGDITAGAPEMEYVQDADGVWPPTPASSFLPGGGSVSPADVAVFAGYRDNFTNPRYRSRFDTAANVDAARIAAAATLLAQAVLHAAGYQGPLDAVQADASFVADLVACFASDPGCDWFVRYTGISSSRLSYHYHRDDDHTGVPLYTGTHSQPHITKGGGSGHRVLSTDKLEDADAITRPRSLARPQEVFIRNALADFTAEVVKESRPSCSSSGDCDGGENKSKAAECIDGTCISEPTAYFHSSLDPAFSEPGYGDYEIVSNSTGPAWTEPYWSGTYGPTLGVSVYQHEDSSMGYGVLAFGALLAIGSHFGSKALLLRLEGKLWF